MNKGLPGVVGITILLTLGGVLGCTAHTTTVPPVAVAMGTPSASEDSRAVAAQKTIEAALKTTVTPAATATATPLPPPTQGADLAATKMAEEQRIATGIAATQTAKSTATPTTLPTWTPQPTTDGGATATAKVNQLATAVAETLTAQPTPTPTFTATPDLATTATANAAQLATAVAATLTAAAPPPTPPREDVAALRVVFAYGDVGNSDLRILDIASGVVRTIAGQGCDEAEPAWSPDGRLLVYHANCAGSYDIYQVDSVSGITTRLTTTSDLDEREPDYAPDGQQLVYRVNPHDATKTNDIGELWVMDTNGNNPYDLGVVGRAPAWSPDGGHIAYMANPTGIWNIYLYTLATQQTSQMTNCATNCRWPAWSPDGQMIIYNTTTKANNTIADALWRIPAAGGNPTRLTTGGNSGRPSWSRTGLIAFNSTVGLEVMQENGTGRRVLLSNNDNWAPYWSR